jgi:dihydrofolate reductase
MRKLIMDEWMTLDGVIQGPSSPEEDRSGGFGRGGWHTKYFDDASMKWTHANVTSAGGYVLGRRTYEIFAAHWPGAGAEEQPLAEPLNTRPKYVASRTLSEPLKWANSQLLDGDVAKAIGAVKEEEGDDLHLIGSAELARTLLEHDLVDELRLMIDPVVVGSGKRLFPDEGMPKTLRLVDSEVTSTGAILATYENDRPHSAGPAGLGAVADAVYTYLVGDRSFGSTPSF